jgi:hypothetical protein
MYRIHINNYYKDNSTLSVIVGDLGAVVLGAIFLVTLGRVNRHFEINNLGLQIILFQNNFRLI